jgi:hypothetical protein
LDSALSELLVSNEEMIDQLKMECLGVVKVSDMLKSMIDQHRQAAAMLRTRLVRQEAYRRRAGNIYVTADHAGKGSFGPVSGMPA